VIGSVIGAFAGAFIGALVLELTRTESTRGSATRVAWGALIGRVAAAGAKTGWGARWRRSSSSRRCAADPIVGGHAKSPPPRLNNCS